MKKKLRPLHTPSPAVVRTDEGGRPEAVEVGPEGRPPPPDGPSDRSPATVGRPAPTGGGGRLLKVVQIREIWRIDDEWWREPVSRLYFEVVLENGKRSVLYRDLARGGWHRQRS